MSFQVYYHHLVAFCHITIKGFNTAMLFFEIASMKYSVSVCGLSVYGLDEICWEPDTTYMRGIPNLQWDDSSAFMLYSHMILKQPVE